MATRQYSDLEIRVSVLDAILRKVIVLLLLYDPKFRENILRNLEEDTIGSFNGGSAADLKEARRFLSTFKSMIFQDLKNTSFE